MTYTSAIIGTGFMAQTHARSVLANGGTVAGFLGSSMDSSSRMAANYSGSRAASHLDEMLDWRPDVVHVCSPNALHAEQALAALKASIAVICEKPLATSAADAKTLDEAGASRSLTTAVPFVYRYHPLVRDIRQRILRTPETPPWLLHGSYLQDWLAAPNSSNWRVDSALGGASRAFGDIGVHWCDLAEFVTGQRITRLSARLGQAFDRGTGSLADGGTEDGGVISFETDTGGIGSLVVSQVSAGRKNRLWFSFDGPSASYSFDQEEPERAWLGTLDETQIIVRDPSRQTGDASRRDALPAGHAQGYQRCFDDFVGDVFASLPGGSPEGMPTFKDGLRAARLTEAVLASATDQSWVKIEP